MDKMIKEYKVRDMAHQFNKRASKGFVEELDILVRVLVKKCCNTHNGGKVTLDRELVRYYGREILK